MPKFKPFPKMRLTFNLEEVDFLQRAARSVAADSEDPDHEIACQVSAKLDASAERTNRKPKRRPVIRYGLLNNRIR